MIIYKLLKIISSIIFLLKKIVNRIMMHATKPLFKSIGRNVIFNPNDSFSYNSIILGNNIFIGSGAKFSGEIKVKDKVMFGPNVTIMAGDHDITQIGRFMIDIKENELY